jgi:hypothetical protein
MDTRGEEYGQQEEGGADMRSLFQYLLHEASSELSDGNHGHRAQGQTPAWLP